MDDQFNPQQAPQYQPQAPQYQPQAPQYQPQAPQHQVSQQPQYRQMPGYQQPQYQQNVAVQPLPQEKRNNGAGGTGFAFGIVTLVFAFCTLSMNQVTRSVCAIFALIFAIPGLACSIVGLAKKNATKALAIIGLIFVLLGVGIVVYRYDAFGAARYYY